MAHNVRIIVSCPDHTGLLSAVTARLFDLGGDLGDTSFAVLGDEGELTSVCRMPDEVSAEDVQRALGELTVLERAEVKVSPFDRRPTHAEDGQVTHRFDVRGTDQPGLVARLTEGFAEFGANIVRMDCQRIPSGAEGEYVSRFELHIPADRADACLNAAANTAEGMGLVFTSESV